MTRIAANRADLVTIVAMIAALAVALGGGASGAGYGDLMVYAQHLWQGVALTPTDELTHTIYATLRGPRLAVAALAGAALAAAGVISQGLFRNSLASPSVIGTEAGAALAAATVYYVTATTIAHWFVVPAAAFAGALVATIVMFHWAARRALALGTLLLAGFALNALLGSLTSLVVSLILEDQQKAHAVLHWLLGGFQARGVEHALSALPGVVIGLWLAMRAARRLDVLALGEDVATTLAVDVPRLRRLSVVAIALLAGTAVSVGGPLPFVGLVVPHLTRLYAGPSHRRLLALTAMNGVTLVVLADLIARTVRAPAEMEVGILTAMLGAPFFLWLLFKQNGREGLA